jgi:pimeloyl-ACP methyl ester carboxylesterase
VTTFGLVHGAWHGAWCWERLLPELAARGQDAVAVDLPGDDPAAGCAEYAAVVCDQLRTAGDDVVLVGHSLGGLTIPLVAAARPVRALVFLCGLIPVPGIGVNDQLRDGAKIFQPGFGSATQRDEAERSFWPDPDAAIAALYGDCPRSLADAAVARLRPQARKPSVEASPLAAWPDVPSVSVLCRDDGAIDPAWSRQAARERLGVAALELDGHHSPFLSRPAELADLLVAATA